MSIPATGSETIRVSFVKGMFACHCTNVQDHNIPYKAGFVWDKARRFWHTNKLGIAVRLQAYFDDSATRVLRKFLIRRRPWSAAVPYPPHLKPYPFQIEAAQYALSQSASYLGLDPGLGKTIAANLVRNARKGSLIYICPPFGALNTLAECEKWATEGLDISIIEPPAWFPSIWIIPDSRLHREDILKNYKEYVQNAADAGSPLTLIVDEAHRFKNPATVRAHTFFKQLLPQVPHVVYMSGTPMPNRPIELYGVLAHSAPETIDFMNRMAYARKFCSAYDGPHGLDESGASNLAELAERIKGPFMLRMRKSEVLKDLPQKRESIVFIAENLPKKGELAQLDKRLLREMSPEKPDLMGEHLMRYRRLLGTEKTPAAVGFLRELLEGGDESILVFAVHQDVVAGLEKGLDDYEPIVITGKTPVATRQGLVKTFQETPERRVFIGNIQAAGIVFTLTKASRVVFVEYDWVPGNNDQAADRSHRVGQTQAVHVQYLVYRNSFDRQVLETNLKKRGWLDHV